MPSQIPEMAIKRNFTLLYSKHNYPGNVLYMNVLLHNMIIKRPHTAYSLAYYTIKAVQNIPERLM